MNPSLLLTKKALSIIAVAVAILTWVIAHATKIVIPLGISKEDAVGGLASVGTFLGVLGASPLPGGTLLKSAAGVQEQAANAVKTMALIFALACLAAVSACATTSNPDGGVAGPTTSAPVQIAEDCGSPVVRDLATHLVDDVASALLTSGDWVQALSNLGATETARLKTDAWPAILCAVEEVGARTGLQLGARANMSPDAAEQTQTLHDRAITWAGIHRAPAAAH